MLNKHAAEPGNSVHYTNTVVDAGSTNKVQPEFIRLPKPGTLCPHTGLSRSKMNELVLPSEINNFKPAVKSISLRKRGQVKAVRLVVYDSLMAYLRSFLQEGSVMVVAFLFLAIAASAMGPTKILEDSLQAQLAPVAGCNLPLGNTTASQSANQNANGPRIGDVSTEAFGLVAVVAAITVTKPNQQSAATTNSIKL